MLGQCDSDSHTPLLVYVRSLIRKEIFTARKSSSRTKKREKETTWKSWDQSDKQGWKHSGYPGLGIMAGYGSQSDSSYCWYLQKR